MFDDYENRYGRHSDYERQYDDDEAEIAGGKLRKPPEPVPDFLTADPAYLLRERHPLYWQYEYFIRNVHRMYESGAVRSFTVDHRQGEPPKLRWTV